MFSSWRIVFRRALSDRLMLFSAAVTILLATTVLAVSPIYSDAVTLASLHRILDEGGSNASIEVSAFESPADFERLDEAVRQVAAGAFSGTGVAVTSRVVGTSVLLDIATDDERFPLGSIQHLERLEEHVTLVDGVWPTTTDEPFQVVLLDTTAGALGLGVGDTIGVTNRRNSRESDLLIVGLVTIDDHSDLFWHDDELAQLGVVETDTFRTYGPILATPEVVLGPMTHLSSEMSWRVLPDHDAVTVAGLPDQRMAVSSLETNLNAALGERVSVFSVDTELDSILAGVEQSVVATRSSVLMLSIQLAILAGYALMHTAGLLVDSRTVETGLLRARGAGNGQILAVSAMEGVLLTLPAVVFAPPLAALLLNLLNRFGPLANIGLSFTPRVSSTAYLLAVLAALACIIALVVPAYRSSRTFNDSLVARSRQETRSFAQRAGWDIALITLAAVGFWQLASYGVQLSATLRDRWGIDPLLVAVPALGMLGGAVLALRFVPFMAGILERLTGRGKRTVSALSSWQIARRPQRYSRATLLLIIAISVGFFVSAYATTWTQSQHDQAAFINGADVKAAPLRSPGSFSDLYLRDAHQQIPGVGHSMPVTLASGQLIRGGPVTRYFAVDASIAGEVLALREHQVGDQFALMMDLLVDSRPGLQTIPVPGEPEWLHVDIAVSSDLPCGEPYDLWQDGREEGPRWLEADHCLSPAVNIVLIDGDGFFQRVSLGVASVNEATTTMSVPLTGALANGDQARPVYPLSLYAVEFSTPMPGDFANPQRADIVFSVQVSDEAEGPRTTIDFPASPEGSFVTPGNIAANRVPPGIEATGANGEVRLSLGTGAARGYTGGAHIHFALQQPGNERVSEVPLVVTGGLLERTGVAEGVRLDLGRFNTLSGIGRIVGTIPLFPTIATGVQEAVVLDLPTLQAASYRAGARLDLPTEYWMNVEDARVEDAVGELSALGSQRIRTRLDETALLVSDPMALSIIAALSLGFVAALVFAVIGFTVNIIVLARERQTEFTLLRAVGLSVRQLRSWLGMEQAAVVFAGVLLGSLIGLTLSSIVLPLISVTQAGVVPVPEPEVIIPLGTIVGLNLFVIVLLGLIVTALSYFARRRDIASQLRMADS